MGQCDRHQTDDAAHDGKVLGEPTEQLEGAAHSHLLQGLLQYRWRKRVWREEEEDGCDDSVGFGSYDGYDGYVYFDGYGGMTDMTDMTTVIAILA